MEKHSLSYYLCCCVAVAVLCMLASACSLSDDGERLGGQEGGHAVTAYMRLSLDIPSEIPFVRAAAPSGGENGDGQEEGQAYENAVADALVFLLPDGEGINSSAGTPILDVLYFSSFTQSGGKWKSESVETEVEYGVTYPVVVVANPGDRVWAEAAGLTLGDVRDHIYTAAWKTGDDGFSYFLMSSEQDAAVTFADGGSEDNPSVAEVDVERVAARVDYKAEASYTCADPAYTGGTVTIEGAAIVNNLTAGSYLFKRVASAVDGTPEYLGDETPLTGVQTNYVIDPWTAVKTAANAASGTPFTLADGTATDASGLYGLYYNDRVNEKPSAWKDIVRPGTEITGQSAPSKWLRVGYTMENTTSGAETGKAYTTGVVFRAKFMPAGLTSVFLDGTQYEEGQTFFAVGETLYPTLEDVMLATVNRDVFDRFYEKIPDDMTYGGLRDGILARISGDPTGYKAWLTERIEGKDNSEIIKDDGITFKKYALEELGYCIERTEQAYSVVINASGKETRSELAAHGTRTYENANCYYTYWIRHSGDDSAQKGEDGFWHNVMGHAIVRNNIYKISVTSIYSLGGDVPDPDISPVVHVWANKWMLLPGEDINM